MTKSFDFLTGATGFVGSALALELLERTDATLVCLVRARDSFGAYERLQSALQEAAVLYGSEHLIPEIFSRCIAIPGNLLDPGFAAHLRPCGRLRDVWHCAASLEFEDDRSAEIFESNLDGTSNIVQLARERNAGRFFHVSTAYVAGRRYGWIPEAPPLPEFGFHNAYERSKAATEQMLALQKDLEIYVLRPSIVVGHSRTFACGPSSTGPYGFMREIFRWRWLFDRQQIAMPAIQLVGDETSVLSLIPVDAFAADAVSIALSATPDRVFHLSRRNTRSALESIRLMCEEFGLPRPRIASHPAVDRMNRMMAGKISFYKPYLSGYRVFSTANTDAVTGGAEQEEIDAFPYVRWYRKFLAAAEPGAGATLSRAIA